jgi:hypothetical protein
LSAAAPSGAGANTVAAPPPADLIWEDEPEGSQNWWLSRTRAGDLQLFLATDSITKSLLCLARNSARPDDYAVLVVVPERPHHTRQSLMFEAKTAAVQKIANPRADVGQPVMGWRLWRLTRVALNQVPLILVAVALGGLLGMAVGLFATSTQLVGWPMLVAGIVIGAASGPPLKFLVDHRFKSVLGPWGRFWVATVSAALGAVFTAGGLLTLFWD